MTVLLWALANWQKVIAGLGVLAILGLLAHDRVTAKALDQQKAVSAALTEQLSQAAETNAETVAALARVTAEKAKAESALAIAATKTQKRTASVAKITQEIDRVPVSPSDPVGPHVAAAIGELRQLKASRADQGPGGKDRPPGIAPGVPR